MGMSRTPAIIALQQAQILARQGKYAEAIPFYQEAVQLSPNMPNVWGSLGYALFMMERNDEALFAFDRAIPLDPDALRQGRTAIHINRVLAFIELERLDEALAAAEAMMAQAPRNSDSWVCLGLVYAELKRYDDAEDALLTAVSLAPTSRFALSQLGRFYMGKVRDYVQAMDACERLLVQRPNDETAWGLKGLILISSRAYQDAVSACERALDCKVENVVSRATNWYNYGVSLSFLGRHFDALAAFDQSDSFVPAREPPLNGRGFIHSRIERHDTALEWYEAAIRANPAAATPRLNKAETLAYLERYDEAESIVNNALASEPESFGAWSVKGLLETRRGRHDEAVAAFRKSIELEPRHGATYMELAALLIALGDADHACQIAERTTSLDPCHSRAWTVKAQALRAAGRSDEAAAAEQHGAALLAEQTAQVDAYFQEKARRDSSES